MLNKKLINKIYRIFYIFFLCNINFKFSIPKDAKIINNGVYKYKYLNNKMNNVNPINDNNTTLNLLFLLVIE